MIIYYESIRRGARNNASARARADSSVEAVVARAAFRARRTIYNTASSCVCACVYIYTLRCTRIRLRVVRATSTPSDSLEHRRAYRIIIIYRARGAHNDDGGGGGEKFIIIILFYNRSHTIVTTHSRSPSVVRLKPRTYLAAIAHPRARV